MMGDPYATSAFLDSSCFSILYPLYHNYDFMNQQQPPYPPPNQQPHVPPLSYRIGPTGQRNILSDAVGIPQPSPIPFATVGQGHIIKRGSASQANRETPCINSSFISRIYSAQIPNQAFPAHQLVNALEKELKFLNADDYFIDKIFPAVLLPLGMTDETVIAELSKRHDDEAPIWNEKQLRFRVTPSSLKESALADWLNNIGITLGKAFGAEPLRLWSHRSCDTAPIGASSSVKRKPDLILLDKAYHKELQNPSKQIDWAFIRAIGEVTVSQSISKRMTDSINAKTYLMFLCQYNRRFVVALSFTGAKEESFRLTITDREGQIHWTVGLNAARSKERSKLFLRILIVLMFGSPADLGLDPNFEIDHTGKCVAITVQTKRFRVVDLIYSLSSVVGRGTRIWVVTHDNTTYTLKDCWIQHERVHSEVLMLAKIRGDQRLTGRVPTLLCGGDVEIKGIVDSTEQYRSGLPGWLAKGKRIHRQLVCTPIGEPLTKYRSKREFINAITSIIITHRILFNEHGILHRDISLNNLLLYRPKEDEDADGVLIDFNYSEELDIIDSDSDAKESEASINEAADVEGGEASTNEATSGIDSIRTGTPPFMAIEALMAEKNEDFAHHPRHDLESILYVILFICTFTKGPNLPRQDFESETLRMKSWFSTQPLRNIGLLKVGDMCQPERAIIAGFTEYWGDFGPFALDLLQLCFPQESNRAGPNKLRHEEMISILERASMTVKESPTNTKNLKRNEPSDPPVPTKRMKRKLEKV